MLLHNFNHDFFVFFGRGCLYNGTDCFRNSALLTDHLSHIIICDMYFDHGSLAFLFSVTTTPSGLSTSAFCNYFY